MKISIKTLVVKMNKYAWPLLKDFWFSTKNWLFTKKKNFINIIKTPKILKEKDDNFYNFMAMMLLMGIMFLSIFLIPFLVLVILPWMKGKSFLTIARFMKWVLLMLKSILIYLSPELGMVETTNMYFYGPAFVINIK